MCTGNTIKTEAGNAADCNIDAACDGVMTVPNTNHTYCGQYFSIQSVTSKSSIVVYINLNPAVSRYSVSFSFVVCDFGLYENGSTCSPCLKVTSGSTGNSWTDRNYSTCALVPLTDNVIMASQYQLIVDDQCVQPEIRVKIIVDSSTSCEEARYVLFTEKARPDCDTVLPYYAACGILGISEFSNRRECEMICECSDPTKECTIHVGLFPRNLQHNVTVCEIQADGLNSLIWIIVNVYMCNSNFHLTWSKYCG